MSVVHAGHLTIAGVNTTARSADALNPMEYRTLIIIILQENSDIGNPILGHLLEVLDISFIL
jgi:hypothetical protein